MDELFNNFINKEVANNLINKLSAAFVWAVNRETPKKNALSGLIKDIQNSDLEPLTKAAFISNAKEILKQYCNQNDIVGMAIPLLAPKAKPEKVDEDWLAQFMDKAKLVSSENFQLIWGKVLAYECNNPNSIPRVLLSILERMDKKDAETFMAVANISVQVDKEFAPFILLDRLDDYSQWGISLDTLVDLKSLGLIEMTTGISNGYSLVSDTPDAKVVYFDSDFQFMHKASVRVGNVIFTKPGMALRNLVGTEKVDGFWEKYCLPLFTRDDESHEKNS